MLKPHSNPKPRLLAQARLAELEAERSALQAELKTQLAIRILNFKPKPEPLAQARLAELEAERSALQAELETQLAIRNRCRDEETALNQGVEDAMAERKRVKELSARRNPKP